MADFTDTLQGDGFARVQRALAGLEGNPLQLDRARRRFSDSPPPYTSDPSGTTTRYASLDPPNEEQQRREERRWQLIGERSASIPREQLDAQIHEEMSRVWNADPCTSWITPMPIMGSLVEDAPCGRWKHEEPLELESELETDTKAESPPRPLSIFGILQEQPQPKPRQPKSDDEKRRIAEQRVVLERKREASRPYYQFVYQISKERERFQEESANGEGADAADINTRAYENVKNTWTRRGIWNVKWGILPRLSWKHEEPLEEEAADDPVPVPVNPLVNGNHEAGEARIITMHGAELENGNAERSPSVSNPSRPSSGKRVLRPTTRQALQLGKRKPTCKDRQPAIASLSPVQSSKVSKAAGKKKLGPQQRLNISQKVSSGGLPLPSGADAAEPQSSPVSVNMREGPWIQPSIPSVAMDSKRITRSKSKQNITDNMMARSSAKPQGISKRPSAKTTQGRGKARKE